MNTDKIILDACCGSRMFWFDKRHPKVIYADIRDEEHILCDGRELKIKPDIKADFRKMPWPDEKFQMVIFDPPHLHTLGKNTWMAKKYGVLFPTWENDIALGFEECWRVLKTEGTLIFKWNEHQVSLSKILEIVKKDPLIGHTSGKHGKTKWLTFMKF